LQRAKIVKINDWIIALSHVSAYQASAAKSLVDLGATCPQLPARRTTKLKLACVVRVIFISRRVYIWVGFAVPLGEFLGGVGGGHAMASGVSGSGEVDEALKMCLKLLKQKIVKS
jgi:F0F1-type ATP synthase membrane subunit c/vacuolar-type H+-ATPase subunit K